MHNAVVHQCIIFRAMHYFFRAMWLSVHSQKALKAATNLHHCMQILNCAWHRE